VLFVDSPPGTNKVAGGFYSADQAVKTTHVPSPFCLIPDLGRGLQPDYVMRLSRYFLPILKENPKEAEIVSHRLMLRAGMIRQQAAGIYSWLPLGKKVLEKVNDIIREEQDRTGAIEILMPTIQSAELWQESGRYDDYGREMLRINDRQDRPMLYGPTNEEMVTDIFRSYVRSYRDLPLNLYHIQIKFRDEIRPRFGTMRSREFIMKDAYSFDIDQDAARHSYNKMFVAYLRTFARMGLSAVPMRADTGPIGGDLSHEFIILAETGESEVYCHKDYLGFDIPGEDTDFDDKASLQATVKKWTSLYAATSEMHDAEVFARVDDGDRLSARGIEVGHIFYFGTKYSDPMGARVMGPDGKEHTVHMGSYGIGPTRLVPAIIEASHDDNGIIWPESVTPFDAGIINMKVGDEACDAASGQLYTALTAAGQDVLYDDRDERAGAKFATADLIGIPWQIIVGPRSVASGEVEVKNRKTGARDNLSLEAAINRFTGAN
jgi:prolyl-tRNA synthetase